MSHKPVYIFFGKTVALHYFFAHICHSRNGIFKNGFPVLMYKMLFVFYGLFRRRKYRTSSFDFQKLSSHSVTSQKFVLKPETFCIGFKKYSSCTVSKNNTSSSVCIINN